MLTISGRNSTVVVEETNYLSFEKPVALTLDTIIHFEQSSNISGAQKATGKEIELQF